jgi:nitrogen fixation/metabolism regulation signal transduction histidine kinase
MDAWRNAKHIEELREEVKTLVHEVKDLRRLILKTVEYAREKVSTPVPEEIKLDNAPVQSKQGSA